ncbi:DNA mismatch repair protein MutS [Tamlana sp. 2_MG-2023]|uniref:MutS-related protein n=1 Tax=unclassified Tamlana TaxID=2614803 RepID=UPI0026E35854|nr:MULTISPECIES: DNA mismatch repair protein MutS [unclassified Tamlana]MDO6760618.1 DNA mismatch repair protein MutS [Tamlana sp. 2_MG-2023]MDO6790874.1 DNA mismatch repair protein MutS [Tamlana sp. 1_MG-2023]
MKSPLEYYKNHLETYQLEVKKLYKKIASLSVLRLAVFVATGFGVYLFFQQWQVALFVAVIGIAIFLYLLSKYTDIKQQREFNKALVVLNQEEIKIAAGDFHNREEGLQFQDSNHFYSLDIDLFGRGSFYQFMNRTTSREGAKTLADLLKANHVSDIPLRQEAIKELAEKTEFRQFYAATSSLIKVETPAEFIVNWIKDHKLFLNKTVFRLAQGFGMISILIFVLTVFNVITYKPLIAYWMFLGLGFSTIYLKKVNVLASKTDKVRDTFRQYATLLDLIEKETFTSALLKEKQQLIQAEAKKASAIFKAFSKSLDALDNRNNLIGAMFGNGLFLMDIKNSYQVEQWISEYGNVVSEWFEVVAFFDAYNSLGTYAYNHPDFVFPEIMKDGPVIKATGLGHPLLSKTKRVDSDVIIDNEQFFIVTGANMAGKSTFLRTISLHIVMANTGLPVCAKASVYSPVKLITSMRTTDSLTDESSYFFSELTRLKYIVDAIKKEPYFIILDEILKGTNSTDKAIGSKKFVEKLVASDATGIIATHDLSLCEIEKELSEVKNYYFDAEIINDELHFDYRLKKGVCQNMNASFLLKKMEIV